MIKQNQIKRTLSHPDVISDISQQLSGLDNPKLSHFADHLCQQYGFIDPQGNYQQAGCIKALRALEQAKKITLSEAMPRTRKRSPRRLDQPLPALTDVPGEINQILNLMLVLVDTERDDKHTSLSVDKIIPKLGYVKTNTVFCTLFVNRVKADASLEFIQTHMPDWYKKIIKKIGEEK